MLQAEDYALSFLVSRFRRLSRESLKTCLASAARRGVPLAVTIAEGGHLVADELQAFEVAALYLRDGEHLHACALCGTQIIAPAELASRCPRCRRPTQEGVLPAAQAVVFDPDLEPRVRRMVLDLLARARTRDRVAEADRLRKEGELRTRPESALAPRDRACAETALGHYRLLSLVGRGSSSWVYRAEDQRDGQVRALKVFYFREGEPLDAVQKKLARFQREAELAGRLEHPNLVAVGPLEKLADRHAIPMDFVDGPTLADVLKARAKGESRASAGSGAADLRGLVDAVGEVARGLHYAHCQGVLHRDVNPRNILFASTGQVFLSDFGCARAIDGASAITGKEEYLGLLPYVAPERLRSESLAEVRSDVYGLGAVLAEVLTGGPPSAGVVPGSWPSATELDSRPDLKAVSPRLLVSLALVANRALARAPEGRYPTALDFADALASSWNEEDTATATAEDLLPRAPTVAAFPLRFASTVALVAFLAGLAAHERWMDRAPRAEDLIGGVEACHDRMLAAGSDREYRTQREQLALALLQAEEAVGAGTPEVRLWSGRSALARGELAEAERELGRAAALDGPRRAEARLEHALAAYLLAERYGTPAQADPWLEVARAECREIAKLKPGSPGARLAEALLPLFSKDWQTAYEGLLRLEADPRAGDTAHWMLGWILARHAAPAQGVPRAEAESAARPNDPWLRLARVLALLDRKAEGSPTDVESAVVIARGLAETWPRLPEAQIALAQAHLDDGAPSRALGPIDRALELDPRMKKAWQVRARLFLETGDPYESVAALTRVLELDPNSEQALFRRAIAYLDAGDPTRGESDLRKYLGRYPQGSRAPPARERLEKR